MAFQIQSLLKATNRGPDALPQTNTMSLFTVAGENIIYAIGGRITTTIGAVANATKLTYVDTVTSTPVDMCATSDLNALAAGALCFQVNVIATALDITGTTGIKSLGTTEALGCVSYLVTDGIIRVDCAGSDGGAGQVRWFCLYMPLSAGAEITAAP